MDKNGLLEYCEPHNTSELGLIDLGNDLFGSS